MAPVYEPLCQELGWELDTAQLERMRGANAARLADLDAAAKDAEENAGEVEVRDAVHAKADYLADIGDRDAAAAAFAAAEAKTAGAGQRMELAFSLVRLDISQGRLADALAGVERCKALCDKGGDWERKNRLKVYEAVLLMATRHFAGAAALLLDAVATFTATELMSYERCIFYTVVLAVTSLDRPTLKDRVLDSPEVLSVIDTMPALKPFAASLYGCDYAAFFRVGTGYYVWRFVMLFASGALAFSFFVPLYYFLSM
jgi:26S proteasome regulatory subunit N7